MEAQTIPPMIVLRDLPGIEDVEHIVSQPGAGWREDDPERVAMIDRVSVALFGITEGDTDRAEPDLLTFLTEVDRIAARHDLVHDRQRFGYAVLPYEQAIEDRDAWEANFDVLYDEDDIDDAERDEFWRILGIDVADRNGNELRCLPSFSRQLIVLAKGLLPGAVFTPDGLGTRRSPDAHAWGAALERAAQEFKARKR